MLSLRLFYKNIAGYHILEKQCKLCIQDLEFVIYAADMLPRFYKILSGEKEKFL